MKVRTDFVTNSSSSSFVVSKGHITALQRDKIIKYRTECVKIGMEDDGGWYITENDYEILGNTGMDNFNMYEFLQRIGVDTSLVRWGY